MYVYLSMVCMYVYVCHDLAKEKKQVKTKQELDQDPIEDFESSSEVYSHLYPHAYYLLCSISLAIR